MTNINEKNENDEKLHSSENLIKISTPEAAWQGEIYR